MAQILMTQFAMKVVEEGGLRREFGAKAGGSTPAASEISFTVR